MIINNSSSNILYYFVKEVILKAKYCSHFIKVIVIILIFYSAIPEYKIMLITHIYYIYITTFYVLKEKSHGLYLT